MVAHHGEFEHPFFQALAKRRVFWYIQQTLYNMAPYPSGKGEVCKTFMQQFDSARRLVDSRSGNPGTAFFLYC